MTIGTLTTKGQITIPHEIRESLRLKSGDRIEFRIAADGSVTLLPLARRAGEVFGILSKHAKQPVVSVDEMNRLVGEAFRRRGR